MNIEDAKVIRKFRVDGCTWRAVATQASKLWPEKNYCPGNQLEGAELCRGAAKVLGEDVNERPWN